MSSRTQLRATARLRQPEPTMAAALELVEARLAEQIQSREELLTGISTYLIGSGGKRVRPAVTVLMFRACGGGALDDIVDIASALELIHSASLLHDDIIDGSPVRRGKDSAFRRFGLPNALVTGDFIFSRAFQLCGRFDAKVINWAAEACIALTEGEIMQGRFRHNPAVTMEDYFEIIGRKTASIFQQGARIAAYLAGAPEPVRESVAQCGYHVGMTFQVVDDLLDIEGTAERVGKPVGLDLRDGNPSLPLVLALGRDPEVARAFEDGALSDAAVRATLERIRRSDVLPEVRLVANDHAASARRNLGVLPPSADKDQLVAVIDQLISRTN
ncbi:MAG: polyprenyl synthetase family protein [Candidatus Binatia bacterium]